MPIYSALLVLILLTSATSANAATCTPTKLSLSEATRLVTSIPEAITERQHGGDVLTHSYEPKDGNSEFYYFVLQTPDLQSTLLQNGLMGYYAVNKSTGEVWNVAPEETVGRDLKNLQRKLRAQHCVSPLIVSKNQNVEPF
jgi:hypothetical protein